MITNTIQSIAILIVMLSMEWRLTILSVMILPLFILAARAMAGRLRDINRQQMEANASMNAMMNETLNIGGALLVKLFGRRNEEVTRFKNRAADVRIRGIDRAMWGSILFAIVSLVTAVGTALVYGVGGYLAIQKAFTVGTIVAFGAYLASLYRTNPIFWSAFKAKYITIGRMLSILLTTKLYFPQVRSSLVQHPRMFERLVYGPRHPLTVIPASAS